MTDEDKLIYRTSALQAIADLHVPDGMNDYQAACYVRSEARRIAADALDGESDE